MKKIVLVFAFVLPLFFACSSDDSVTDDVQAVKVSNGIIKDEVVDGDCFECPDIKDFYTHFEYYKHIHEGSFIIRNFHTQTTAFSALETSQVSFTFKYNPVTNDAAISNVSVVVQHPVNQGPANFGKVTVKITNKIVLYNKVAKRFDVGVYYDLIRTAYVDSKGNPYGSPVVSKEQGYFNHNLRLVDYLDLQTFEKK